MILFMLAGGFAGAAYAEIIIKSSVSPEFPDGLHAKYLRYIAEKAELPIEIFPMPFARRVASLKNGEINLMVGLKSSYPELQFKFLQPSYERTGGVYFVRSDSQNLSTTKPNFGELVVAFSINHKEMLGWANDNFRAVVTLSSLEQKIMMLEKRRIDAFVHFQSSANYKIKQLGLEGVIVPATYQSPRANLPYHFAINEKSDLFSLRKRLETIISEGVKAGDFAKIRYNHEASL